MRTDAVLDPAAIALLRSLDEQKPGSFRDFVRMFVTEAPERVKKIEAAYKAGNASDLSQHAHYLRSACLALGAGQLAATCHDLEHLDPQSLTAGNTELNLGPLHARLREAMIALLELAEAS
ncbi:MAG TPA: Hpt domain-containing protein [Arenimonas sp.]|jgi:HPt (histidine-containing phosphotransfer) domain-containing protein|nr:Hpt domain-containing protein [Arenimonas sp.]HOZ04861.1 Hpt domain-containing protein [Arenimonas sp.]HPO24376.1 Hpt domain-containing protein [Arenimonas sp.]HPW32924.1 Hpt domain-containing protein [Arenimonas sp.]